MNAQVYNPQEDGPYVEQVDSTFAEISREFLNTNRSVAKDNQALEEIQISTNQLLSDKYLNVTASIIFRIVELSVKLPNRRKILNDLAARCYTIHSSDTSINRTTSFLHAMSVLELNRSEYETSLLFADSVLTFPKGKINPRIYAGNYTIRGYCNENLGRRKDAQNDFLKAAKAFKNIPDAQHLMISARTANARAHHLSGDFQKALEISTETLLDLSKLEASGKKMDEDYQVYRIHSLILVDLKRTEEAIESASRALQIVTARKEVMPIARCNITLAEVYAAAGQQNKSLTYFKAAKVNSKFQNDPHELLSILEKEALVLKGLGRYKEALDIKERCITLKDSITLENQNLRLFELKEENKTNQIRNELNLAEAEKIAFKTQQDLDHTQKLILGFSLATILTAAFMLYFQLTRRKRAQHLLEETVKERTASLVSNATKLKLNAQKLELSNEELERFAFAASHDLKTPIRNINCFLTLVKRRIRTSNPEELEEYIEMSINHTMRLQTIVNDILRFSRIGTDIADISSQNHLELFFKDLKTQLESPTNEQGASIEILGSATVTAPLGYLNQIFSNLITNGLKFNESPFPRVKIQIQETDKETVRIEVSDNGIGIREEYQDQIFEMFKRLHSVEQYEGTGLGLAVCKKVVKRLGGNIELESRFGEGSKFTIELPIDCTTAKAQEQEANELIALD